MPFICAFMLLVMAQKAAWAAPDEIDTWVKTFNVERLDGLNPSFDLPVDTPPEKIVAALAQEQKRDEQFRGYKILEIKKIEEPKSPLYGYTVVLIASSKGSKTMIVLWCPLQLYGGKVIFDNRKDSPGGKLGIWNARAFYITTVP